MLSFDNTPSPKPNWSLALSLHKLQYSQALLAFVCPAKGKGRRILIPTKAPISSQTGRITLYPWTIQGLGCQPLNSWKSTYNFWILNNLPTNSLLWTGSLTENANSQLIHCYMYYILYHYNKVSREKKMLLRKW